MNADTKMTAVTRMSLTIMERPSASPFWNGSSLKSLEIAWNAILLRRMTQNKEQIKRT
jgi:hypothetical protein